MRFLALAFFLTACHSFTRIPQQDEAEAIVWYDVYQTPAGRHPTPVEWLTGDLLDCRDGHGFYKRGPYLNGPETTTCVGGLYWDSYDFAQVALPLGFPISDTAYAHEQNHARLYYTTGNPEGGHDGPSWQPGGLLSQAVAALKAAGL